jgi:hypothetical protein
MILLAVLLLLLLFILFAINEREIKSFIRLTIE